ncbi:DUF2726 domain-containing protein [Nibribacter ruber]|uniref:DUF2726 domain-containing protein n=1 Tax=Nibribacter ruber TaxID=2698458 RepID=A0A6P1NW59_9BACT|nr:DUF2726 domain-containing protein [Nibribacter ruber]QHL87947.1 DUF2726 domain-containing protein [Nibribacter ruber]
MNPNCDIHYFAEAGHNALSLLYWTFWPEGSRSLGPIYPIEKLAEISGKTADEVLEAVRSSSAASARCAVCQTSFPLKDREELEQLQFGFNGYQVMCTSCSREVTENAPIIRALHRRGECNLRPIIPIGREETFEQLTSLFPHVFPSVSPAAFLDEETSQSFAMDATGLELFHKARFSFALADEESHVLAVIDHPFKHEQAQWSNNVEYKERLMNHVGVPYYVFPKDRKRFLSTEVPRLLKAAELRMKFGGAGMLEAAAFISQEPPF